MADTLIGKVALVTGAASGIGRASACAFAREGARVVVADVDEAGGAETVALIRHSGGEARLVTTDVSRATEVERMVQQIIDTYGRLDCAHNNAGISQGYGLRTAELGEADWDAVLAANLKGVWLCMKHEIPRMLEQGHGAIVNTSSVLGLVGTEGGAAYVASKHGIVGLTRTAALEYARSGIRVNAVCPGAILTPLLQRGFPSPAAMDHLIAMEPVGRIGEPEEVAGAVVWLCSDAASFVTGHAMTVDGGLTAR
jgi:NAD(P)-dependent dehydrogenase (short-subunit alcohol dehydrogenase family)